MLTIARSTLETIAYPNHSVSQSQQVSIRGVYTQTIPTGPAGIENANVVAMEGKSPMILKATANI
jgi:hypothetical protein